MMSNRFCVLCGRGGEDVKISNGICLECFKSKYLRISSKKPVKLVLCPLCGDHKYKGRWRRDYVQEKLVRDVESTAPSVLISPYNVKISKFKLLTSLELLFKRPLYISGETYLVLEDYDELVKMRLTIPAEIKFRYCDRCLREKSGNYEAVLQVRSKSKKMNPEEKRRIYTIIVEGINRAYKSGRDYRVIDSKDFEYGIDVYFSSYAQAKRAAKNIKRILGGSITKTEKLVKVDKSGKRVSRKTILVKLDKPEK